MFMHASTILLASLFLLLSFGFAQHPHFESKPVEGIVEGIAEGIADSIEENEAVNPSTQVITLDLPALDVAIPPEDDEAVVALVLGGGAARGLAHIGVIRALEEADIPIDMIVGTSIGAIVGGLYAEGFSIEAIETLFDAIAPSEISQFSLPLRGGILDNQRLYYFLQALLEQGRVKDTPLPFYPIATNLNTGKREVILDAPLARAIQASAAIPILFAPVPIGEDYYYDGGLKGSFAANVARAQGADYVIAVDISPAENYNPLYLSNNILSIISSVINDYDVLEEEFSDSILQSDKLSHFSAFSFNDKALLIEEGYRITQAALPDILADLRNAELMHPAPRILKNDADLPSIIREAKKYRDAQHELFRINPQLNLIPSLYSKTTVQGMPPATVTLSVLGAELEPLVLESSYHFDWYSKAPSHVLNFAVRWQASHTVIPYVQAGYHSNNGWRFALGSHVDWYNDDFSLENDFSYEIFEQNFAVRHFLAMQGFHLYVDYGTDLVDSSLYAAVDARANFAWQAWQLHPRLFFATTSSQRSRNYYALGSSTLLRGYASKSWQSPLLMVANLELAYAPETHYLLLNAITLEPSYWVFSDIAYSPHSQWRSNIGIGTGVQGNAFGFAPFNLRLDIAYGFEPSNWQFNLSSDILWPEAWR